jgi:uncharacterized membrane protein HdeD (DUF308 family)
MNWRASYQLFSGILFIALGIIIFVRGKGYAHIFSTGLFALLLVAFGIYRIALYLKLAKHRSGNLT